MQELERIAAVLRKELEQLETQPDSARAQELTRLLEQCRNLWVNMDEQRRKNPARPSAVSLLRRAGSRMFLPSSTG